METDALFYLIRIGWIAFGIGCKRVPKALLAFNKISVGFARGIFFILDVLSTMVSMIVVDYFMESVSATLWSVVVIAVIIAILSVKDIGKPKKENTEL